MRPHVTLRSLAANVSLLALGLTYAAVGAPVPFADAIVTSVPSPLSANPTPSPGAASAAVSAHARAHVALAIRSTHLNVLDGRPATVTGTLRPALMRRTVRLQRLTRHGWQTIAHVATRARGRFMLRYVPHHLVNERVRVVFAGDVLGLPAHRPAGRLSSYHLAGASWYGGGGGLACGGQLTSATMGVANKTLPCGTLVTLRYGGRSVRVPVVDRGPYVAGREFDLTEATKRALRFDGVGTVWSTR